MSGNTISIFPIMMVIMLLFRPIKTLFTVGSTFKALDASVGGSGINRLKPFVLTDPVGFFFLISI
jgi:hypothetical protein